MTLLEEVAECVIPWLENLEISLVTKLAVEVVGSIRKSYSNVELPPTATVRLLKVGLRLAQLISAISSDYK